MGLTMLLAWKAMACGSRIRAGSWVLLASMATPVAVREEKRKRFRRCAAQIACPNTTPTGRWLARVDRVSQRKQHLL